MRRVNAHWMNVFFIGTFKNNNHLLISRIVYVSSKANKGSKNRVRRLNMGDLPEKGVLVAGKTARSVTEAVGKKALDSSGGRLESGCSGRESHQQKEGNGWIADRRQSEQERSKNSRE